MTSDPYDKPGHNSRINSGFPTEQQPSYVPSGALSSWITSNINADQLNIDKQPKFEPEYFSSPNEYDDYDYDDDHQSGQFAPSPVIPEELTNIQKSITDFRPPIPQLSGPREIHSSEEKIAFHHDQDYHQRENKAKQNTLRYTVK